MINLFKYLGLPFLLFLTSENLFGQLKFFGGFNYCSVRNEVLKNEQPIYSWHWGGGIRVYPVEKWERISMDVNLMFSQKGYEQYAGEWYEFKFNYFSFQLISNYHVTDFLSLQGGIDFSDLYHTNVKEGLETYNHFDFGLIGGISFFENKRMGFYTRLIYGLTPMLEYDAIDPMGNFKSVKDLKNVCLLAGIRLNLYHEKISF